MRLIHTFLDRFRNSRTWIFVLGFGATLWFLVRVVPKPSRATYPCMKAAAPLMSSFVVYLLAMAASVASFRKLRDSLRQSRYTPGLLFLTTMLVSTAFVVMHSRKDAVARILDPVDETFPVASNQPIGEAKGLHPGRVVWVHDRRATNENYQPVSGSNDYWYSHQNTDEAVVMDMLEKALLHYAGTDSIQEAWDLIFRAHNQSRGRGDVGYVSGERIAFKINLTNQSARDSERPQRMDATPQLLNAILHQLVHVVGVSEFDITMGDPYRKFRQEYIDLVMSRFPNVYYVDGTGSAPGIEETVPTAEMVLKFSDTEQKWESSLPSHYIEATYLINIPCLKTHNEGGITLIAKNHQGSYLEKDMAPKDQYAINMHYCLPANKRGTKKFRHTVDYLGHEQTGGKGLIYIIDGIWAGESWEGWITKFRSDPFKGGYISDYPNTLLVGQDPVALESVGFDILFNENVVDPFKKDYPVTYKAEIADYLKQCASSEFWPDGIQYDPEGDGTPLGSLGVFEHWNNPTDRKYSRNLGDGEGIELLYFDLESPTTGLGAGQAEQVQAAFPNPFSSHTRILKPGWLSDQAVLDIYDLKGARVYQRPFSGQNEVVWSGTASDGTPLPDGLYVYTIGDGTGQYSGRVMLQR